MTTITTAAELDALPVGSVVRTAVGTTFVREDGSWREPGWTWHPSSRDIFLPAVLLTPDEPDDTADPNTAYVRGYRKALADQVATGAGVVPAPATVDREAVRVARRRETSVSTVKPDREWLAGMIPLGFDPKRDGVSNVYEAADAILAAWPGRTEAEVRADERERIAREIEETAPAWSLTTNQAALVRQFARIAREGGRADAPGRVQQALEAGGEYGPIARGLR